LFLKKLQIPALILLAAAISCAIAFINGFPLVYPDTGAYLNSGFEALPPYDRTIFYGLFARHISLHETLWLVVFVQAVLLCYLLFITFEIFLSGKKRNLVFLGSVTLLSFTSGYSYITALILPDIFTPISLLCFINLLLNIQLNRYARFFISFLFMYSIATQVSSIGIFFLLFICLAIYFLYKKIRKKSSFLNFKRFALCLWLYMGTLILIPTVHALLGGRFSVSSGSHVFIMNHLLETGILKIYLNENCTNHNHKICAYKDKLGNNLMWEIEGPLYKTGSWEANKEEYNTIIYNVLTTPKYLWPLIKEGISSSFKQFFAFDIAVVEPQLEGTAPYGQIMWRYKHPPAYVSSKQNTTGFKLNTINTIQRILVYLSMTAALFFLFSNLISDELKWMILLLILYCLLNSVISANFSTVDHRFQNRLAWLFPVYAFLGLFSWSVNKFK